MVKDELEKVYSKYKKKVNMTFTELLIWSKKSPDKFKNKYYFKINLGLLRKNKSKWNYYDINNAKKIIYLLSSLKCTKKSAKNSKKLTNNDINLLNLGYNPYSA